MGTYSIVAYMMSTIVVALPMLIVNTLASGLPWLYLIGWQGNYWLYLLVLFKIVCVGFAWGLVIGLVAGRADLAALAIPFIIVPQVFIAGMYRASTRIPAYLRWAQWQSVFIKPRMKHGYSALLCLEMNDQNHPGITEDFKRENLERNYINPQQDFVFYATLPVVIYAALIIAGMVYLKISAMRR